MTPCLATSGGLSEGEGTAAFSHENQGCKPRNDALADEAKPVSLMAGTTHAGANHTRLTALLRDREGIVLSLSTVQCILTKPVIPNWRRGRPPKHRVRRQRMPQAGMPAPIDGSFHRWLAVDSAQFTLLLAVADAISVVANAMFSPDEDTRSYFALMQGLIERR